MKKQESLLASGQLAPCSVRATLQRQRHHLSRRSEFSERFFYQRMNLKWILGKAREQRARAVAGREVKTDKREDERQGRREGRWKRETDIGGEAVNHWVEKTIWSIHLSGGTWAALCFLEPNTICETKGREGGVIYELTLLIASLDVKRAQGVCGLIDFGGLDIDGSCYSTVSCGFLFGTCRLGRRVASTTRVIRRFMERLTGIYNQDVCVCVCVFFAAWSGGSWSCKTHQPVG